VKIVEMILNCDAYTAALSRLCKIVEQKQLRQHDLSTLLDI